MDCDPGQGIGARCLAKRGMLFDKHPDTADYGKYVWELCPSKCPEQVQAADEESKQVLTTKLRRLAAMHPDDAAAQRPKEEL